MQSGDVLASLWGIEQTNVDYFEVVKVSSATVTLRELARLRVENAREMTHRSLPLRGRYVGAAFRRKVHHGPNGAYVRIQDRAVARSWSGRTLKGSDWA